MSLKRVTSFSLFLLILSIFLSFSGNSLYADNGVLFLTEKMAYEAADYFITKITQIIVQCILEQL